MLCGLRAGWGRRRAAASWGQRALCGEPEEEAGAGGGAGAGTLAGGGWDEAGGRLWGQIASRGDAAEWGPGPGGSAMAAQGDPLSGYLPPLPSETGSNSERSADSPPPGSEEDAAAPRPPRSPEWGEERFRVDRKKLEAMLQGKRWALRAPGWSPPALPPQPGRLEAVPTPGSRCAVPLHSRPPPPPPSMEASCVSVPGSPAGAAHESCPAGSPAWAAPRVPCAGGR